MSQKENAINYINSLDNIGIVLEAVGEKKIKIAFPARTKTIDAIASTLVNSYGAAKIDQYIETNKTSNEIYLTWEVFWDTNPSTISLLSSKYISAIFLALSVISFGLKLWDPIVNTIAAAYWN